jgi:hypothetical protein
MSGFRRENSLWLSNVCCPIGNRETSKNLFSIIEQFLPATPYPNGFIGAKTLRLFIVSIFFLNDNEPKEKVHYIHFIFPVYKKPLFVRWGQTCFLA